MNSVYLSLGSNQGDCVKHLADAFDLIEEEVGKIALKSSIYETEPWGFQAKENFLNTVLLVETTLNPEKLMGKLLKIERQLGRKRTTNGYQSRSMDIDILFYGNQIVETKDVSIPHPKLHLRNFVLVPLCEIAPNFEHPNLKKTIQFLLKKCPDKGTIQKMEPAKSAPKNAQIYCN